VKGLVTPYLESCNIPLGPEDSCVFVVQRWVTVPVYSIDQQLDGSIEIRTKSLKIRIKEGIVRSGCLLQEGSEDQIGLP
jgi:hypothetical protein